MKKNVKSELFFVILKILLCVAVLAASTYALFTSETQNNISVTSGEMDMNLYQITLDGQRFDLAKHNEGIFTEGDWEPNQTRIAFLVVENKSNIPVKYTLQLDVDIGELEGAFDICSHRTDAPFDVSGKSWEILSDGYEVGELKDGINTLSGKQYGELQPGEEHCYALMVHMIPEGANEYQDKTMEFNIHLFAMQGNAPEETTD